MPQVLKWLNLEAEQSGVPARGMFVNHLLMINHVIYLELAVNNEDYIFSGNFKF